MTDVEPMPDPWLARALDGRSQEAKRNLLVHLYAKGTVTDEQVIRYGQPLGLAARTKARNPDREDCP